MTLSVYTNPFSVHLQCFSPTCLHYGDFSVRESVLAFRGREEEEEEEEEEACFPAGNWEAGWVGVWGVRQESDSFQSLAALHFTSVGLSQFFRRRRKKTSSRAKRLRSVFVRMFVEDGRASPQLSEITVSSPPLATINVSQLLVWNMKS